MATAHDRLMLRPERVIARRRAVRAVARPDRLGPIAVWVTTAYLFTKMIYVFGHGNAQPADIMMAGLALFVTQPAALLRFLREELLLTAMVLWIMLVNTAWLMLTAKFSFALSASYYVFNLMIVIAVFSTRLRQPALFDRVVPRGLLAAIACQLFVVLTGFGATITDASRSSGTFVNPNQLAYWGVLALSVLMVLRRNRIVFWDLAFIAMTLYLELAANSRAGLVSTGALLLIWLFFALRTPVKRVLGMLLGFLLIGVSLAAHPLGRGRADATLISSSENRFEQKADQSQYEVRNYSRIVKYYQYTVLGAGEGYLSRFTDPGELAIEIHSTFGTMLFSYGIIGLTLFLGVIGDLSRRLPVGISIYILPSLFYGLTHQGLRFSFFWVMIGLMMGMAREFRARARPSPTGTAVRKHQPRDAAYLRRMLARGAGDRSLGHSADV